MPNKITYDARSGLYKVHVDGMITTDDIIETIRDLESHGVAGSLIHILIDTLRETSEMNIYDVDTIADALPGKKRFRSAILSSSGHININEHYLLEKAAAKKGKTIRVFTDRDKAINWLFSCG